MALNQGSGDGRHPCSASKPWWQQPPGALAAGLQHQLQHFASEVQRQAAASSGPRLASLTAGAAAAAPAPPAPLTAADTVAAAASLGSRRAAPKPVDREELGRSTWVLLHTLAAQLPERPSRQQQRDVKALISSLSRVYPCGDCAHHFQQILKSDPPDVSSGPAFQQWMCRTHNTVNRSIGKPVFNCDLVGARWAPLDCDAANSCDMGLRRPR